MNILYQCNDKYAPYCGISVTSLFENNKDADSICVYILDDNISDINKNKFSILAEKYDREIKYIETQPLISKMKELGIPTYRGSYTTNMKMFVNEFIADDVDRLIYIDSDTIVSGSLSDLLAVDFNGKPIAMVLDSLVEKYKCLVGLKEEDRYFNSGVLLFNVKQWKEQKCTEKIIEHTKKVRAQYSAPDQDLINLNIRDDILLLSPKFNMQPALYMFDLKTYFKVFNNPSYYSMSEIEETKKDVRIYHFFRVMGEFPWHKDNLHPFNDLFDKYMKISPWADYIKQPSQASAVFSVEKLMYKCLPKPVFAQLFKMSHEFFMAKSNKMSLKQENNKLM